MILRLWSITIPFRMVIQYFIIAIVFFVSVAYAILLLIKAFKRKDDPCKGCSGCAIHEQMLKNKSTSEGKTPSCYRKK